jgi:hypothetical protein
MHEAQYHERKCFLTLTLSDENIPPGGSLDPDQLKKFFRRTAAAVKPEKIRYFACGEYGDLSWRPHYHVLLFGWDFPDKVPWKSGATTQIYTSSQLEKLWPLGFATVGSLTYETANYVAGYVMKKINGKAAAAHYAVLDQETGELIDRVPEFIRMSRRPGIAARWYEDFGREVFPDDFVVVKGREHPVPRYYFKKLKADKPLFAEDVLARRVARAQERGFDGSTERLRVRETVAQAKTNLRRRDVS